MYFTRMICKTTKLPVKSHVPGLKSFISIYFTADGTDKEKSTC